MKFFAAFPLLLLACAICHADIYRVTDEHGNTTYTNVAPQQNGKQAEAVKLKPTNVTEEGKHLPGDNETYFEELKVQQDSRENEQKQQKRDRQAAWETLQQAHQNLEQARAVKAGDYFNLKDGGLRYKPEYLERVEAAEKRLQEAQKHYDSLQ